jgi:hypothetical protein
MHFDFETGDKPESAMRDCWWVITPASGREYPPVGTEAFVVRAILKLVSKRAWGVRSPKHPAALCVSTTGLQGEFACHDSGSSWLTEKYLPSNLESVLYCDFLIPGCTVPVASFTVVLCCPYAYKFQPIMPLRQFVVLVSLANAGAFFTPISALVLSLRKGSRRAASSTANRCAPSTASRLLALGGGGDGTTANNSDETPVPISAIGTAALLIAGTTVRQPYA